MISRRSFLVSTIAAPFASRIRVLGKRTRGFDPWVEVYPEALRANARALSQLSGGRKVMAVIKNNGYGLGVAQVAKALEPVDAVSGFAVVKLDAAHRLRDAGVMKPVLHMGLVEPAEAKELARRDVMLSLYTEDAPAILREAGPAAFHAYIDTGMSRMGIPYHKALPWLSRVLPLGDARGMFMGFTEDDEYDIEQLRRFRDLGSAARGRGMDPGELHAGSSDAVFNMAAAHLDFVRPGISLYGAYPSNEGVERRIRELTVAFRLKARVVRVEQLRAGDSVSYGRNYVAARPTWVATLPIGHADGYSREAVSGGRVLIGSQIYPVIGAVSASHTIVELGSEASVAVGDEATLMGPEIHPNDHAFRIGRSVYDVLMHMNPGLPRKVISNS